MCTLVLYSFYSFLKLSKVYYADETSSPNAYSETTLGYYYCYNYCCPGACLCTPALECALSAVMVSVKDTRLSLAADKSISV